jgi:hypothetical protein
MLTEERKEEGTKAQQVLDALSQCEGCGEYGCESGPCEGCGECGGQVYVDRYGEYDCTYCADYCVPCRAGTCDVRAQYDEYEACGDARAVLDCPPGYRQVDFDDVGEYGSELSAYVYDVRQVHVGESVHRVRYFLSYCRGYDFSSFVRDCDEQGYVVRVDDYYEKGYDVRCPICDSPGCTDCAQYCCPNRECGQLLDDDGDCPYCVDDDDACYECGQLLDDDDDCEYCDDVAIGEVVARHRAAGGHFFDGDSLRVWGTTVGRYVYGGRYFTTGDRYDDGYRYSVREILDDGTVQAVCTPGQYATARDAQRAAAAAVAATQ